MAQNKSARMIITLECMCSSQTRSLTHRTSFRYTSTKNRRNTPGKIQLKKFCPRCNCHSYFQEIK